MYDNKTTDKIVTLCRQALQEAEQQGSAPFDHTRFKMAARERVLAATCMDNKVRVDIASDGLDLKGKQLTEQILKEALQKNQVMSAGLTIYFKRLEKPIHDPNSNKEFGHPKPAQHPRVGPFGITMRKQAIPGVHRIIAVSSGKGGVGKSTVSVQVALALGRAGCKVGILDADIYGPSVPTMMGISGPVPVSAENLMIPIEASGIKCLSFGLMADVNKPAIWRGPMVSKALEQLFYQTDWGELDYLILDLPPGTGDVQLTMIEKLPIYAGIIVSTPQRIAIIDTQKGVEMFRRLGVPMLGIVENMSHFVCPCCDHRESIFGDQLQRYADKEQLAIVAQIPLTGQLRKWMDEGKASEVEFPLRGVFDRLASHILESKI